MLSLNTGDTGFVMLCTALVCMMTPALALFYGGMVRKKNVLTIMMQNFISMGVTAIIWIFGGFSLAFGPDVGGLFGDRSGADHGRVRRAAELPRLPEVPHLVDDLHLHSRLPLDLGRRLPRQDRRNGLCGRYRDPRQRRFCGACLGHFPRTA